MALRSARTHTAATASIVDTIIRAYMAADVSREKKSLGSRRMFNLLEKITNRRGSDGKTVGGAGSTAKPSLSSARGACVLRCAVVIHEPCAQRVCAWCVSDSKLYAMVEPLRLACSPGDGMHTQASVDIVRSLLRIDHRAPSVLGNDPQAKSVITPLQANIRLCKQWVVCRAALHTVLWEIQPIMYPQAHSLSHTIESHD
jgi:hypothetical protein